MRSWRGQRTEPEVIKCKDVGANRKSWRKMGRNGRGRGRETGFPKARRREGVQAEKAINAADAADRSSKKVTADRESPEEPLFIVSTNHSEVPRHVQQKMTPTYDKISWSPSDQDTVCF